jgi:hypothetical protein
MAWCRFTHHGMMFEGLVNHYSHVRIPQPLAWQAMCVPCVSKGCNLATFHATTCQPHAVQLSKLLLPFALSCVWHMNTVQGPSDVVMCPTSLTSFPTDTCCTCTLASKLYQQMPCQVEMHMPGQLYSRFLAGLYLADAWPICTADAWLVCTLQMLRQYVLHMLESLYHRC